MILTTNHRISDKLFGRKDDITLIFMYHNFRISYYLSSHTSRRNPEIAQSWAQPHFSSWSCKVTIYLFVCRQSNAAQNVLTILSSLNQSVSTLTFCLFWSVQSELCKAPPDTQFHVSDFFPFRTQIRCFPENVVSALARVLSLFSGPYIDKWGAGRSCLVIYQGN